MKTHNYLPNSWQTTTDTIKEKFGWKSLTEAQAKVILALYIVGTPVENIIEELEKEVNK